MRGPAARPIVIAAGGTGGHFFPAEALAAELIARGQRVVLMTDARSGAANSPVFAQRELHVLKGAGIAGRGVVRAGKAVVAVAAGIAQARAILAELNASAVVGLISPRTWRSTRRAHSIAFSRVSICGLVW